MADISADGFVEAPPSLPTRVSDHLVLLEGWRRLFAAFGFGAASALALPPLGWWPVMFATVPLTLFLLDGAEGHPDRGVLRRNVPAFAVGWWFGFGYLLAGLWWVGSAFLVEAEQFAWALPLAVAGLPAGLALFYGAGAVVARALGSDGWPRVLALAAAFAAAEWLRGHVLTGFPWNALGYAAMPNAFAMQPAALWGTYGVTFLALLVFAAPALLVRPGRGEWIALTLVAALALGHASWSASRLFAAVEAETIAREAAEPVRIRIVQPAIDQREKWKAGNASNVFGRHVDLSTADTGPQTAGLAGVTYLVWPESAFPFLIQRQPGALAAIADILPPGTTLVTGAMRGEDFPLDGHKGSPARVFNSVLAIDHEGVIQEARDKTHLVPFGEYLPFQGVLEALGIRQLTGREGGFAAGRRRTLMQSGNVPFLPLVCYEVIFPGALFDRLPERPRFLLNVTNDGWFGRTAGPHQHAHQARVRAVEEGLPLVRAANSGVSMVVTMWGAVPASLPLGADGVLDATLPVTSTRTPYSRWGDLPLGLVLALSLVVLIRRRAH